MTSDKLPGNDQLFRHALSIPEVVRQFLTTWLPQEFIALVDWSTLEIEKVSGINSALTERREDIVYRIDASGKQVCFYILLEHQSASDRFMPLRVLEYITLIWQKHRAAESSGSSPSRPLPLVIPVVLYPGPGKWTATRRLRDLIDIPDSIAGWAHTFAPDSGFCIVELSGLPLEKLADGPTARAILAALEQQRSGMLPYETVRTIIAELFCDSQRQVAETVAAHLWNYVLRHSELNSQEIYTIIEQSVPQPIQPDFMSTAELLKQEGLEQGLERGREEGRFSEQRAAIFEALEVRFGSVPTGLVEAITALHDHDKLRALHRTAIRCADIDSFASEL